METSFKEAQGSHPQEGSLEGKAEGLDSRAIKRRVI